MNKKSKGNISARKTHITKEGNFKRLDGFLLNAVSDAPDLRDFQYEPALIPLQNEIPAPENLEILDQGQEGACTGFGLAAVINLLLAKRGSERRVSARMLYEMAKKFDEWEGEDYSGSSCRGAISGWYSLGVCSEDLAPYHFGESGWNLTIKQAKDARKTAPGAYYRIRKRLSDYHAALNEVEAIYVSARVHEGWWKQNIQDGRIPYSSDWIGGHAFAIVGYNDEGFWVQNSWGESWGNNGIALWTYEDWLENVQDAWVARLALPTPQIWHLTPGVASPGEIEEGLFKRNPKRAEIIGHFIHIDDGKFDDKGKYWTNLETVKQTAQMVAMSKKYEHLLLYAHGGLNSVTASASRIVAMKEVFKENGIYPFHFMYDTGLLEEIKDVVFGKENTLKKRAGGFITDFTDKLIESTTRHAGRAIWREMKSGAQKPFEQDSDGTLTLRAFLDAFADKDAHHKKVHIVGHSTGAILLASLLQSLAQLPGAPRIKNCMLLAPACTHGVFKNIYLPLVNERNKERFGIEQMRIYNLDERLELEDTVTPLYRKSLLYLVSNAYEEIAQERILGMQIFRRYLRNLPGSPVFRIEISDGSSNRRTKTASKTHGGFDNDIYTMNDILRNILQVEPKRVFTEKDLDY